jgi:hypothetical protein
MSNYYITLTGKIFFARLICIKLRETNNHLLAVTGALLWKEELDDEDWNKDDIVL